MQRRCVAFVLVLSLAAATAAGCSRRHYGPTVPTAADGRWQRRLEGLARRELSCRAVRMVALTPSVFQVDGCGALMEYELLCAGRHCSWHRIEPAALRASRDFACPLTALTAAVPSATRRDLAGCGRAASYTLACGANHCEWQSYDVSGGAAPGYAAAGAPPGYGATGAPPGYGATPPGYGSASGTVSGGYTGDESLADVAIPPPPGASADGVVVPPQPITAVPSTDPAAAGTPAPEPAPPAPGSTDDIVIPPPP